MPLPSKSNTPRVIISVPHSVSFQKNSIVLMIGTVREFYGMFTDVAAILRMMSFVYSKLLKGVKNLLKMFAFVY